MGRTRAKRSANVHVQIGEQYDLVRIGSGYFLKGDDGVLRSCTMTPISEAAVQRLMAAAGVEEDV